MGWEFPEHKELELLKWHETQKIYLSAMIGPLLTPLRSMEHPVLIPCTPVSAPSLGAGAITSRGGGCLEYFSRGPAGICFCQTTAQTIQCEPLGELFLGPARRLLTTGKGC